MKAADPDRPVPRARDGPNGSHLGETVEDELARSLRDKDEDTDGC